MAFSTYDLQVPHQSTADDIRARSPRLKVTADGVAIALAVLVAIATLVIMALTWV